MATRTLRLLLALGFSISACAAFADCVVKDFFVKPDRLQRAPPASSPTAVAKSVVGTVYLPNMGVVPAPGRTVSQAGVVSLPTKAAEVQNAGPRITAGTQPVMQTPLENLKDAIHRRNLDEFRKALPTDAAARDALIQNHTDYDPMYFAVVFGATSIVRELLALGAKVSGSDYRSRTLVQSAISSMRQTPLGAQHGVERAGPTQSDYVEIVKLLVAAGAEVVNPSDSNAYGFPVFGSPETPETLDLTEFLMSHGVPIEADSEGRSPLLYAVGAGNTAVVALILKRGRPSQALRDFALARAVSKFEDERYTRGVRLNIAMQLLNAGADLNAGNAANGGQEGYQIVYGLVVQKDYALLKALLRRGADPNVVNSGHDKLTPLMWAASVFDLDAMKLLIASGADPNRQSAKGNTALHIALAQSLNDGRLSEITDYPGTRRRIVEFLLMHATNPALQSLDGVTPLMMTNTFDVEIIDLMLQRGGVVATSGQATSYYRQYTTHVGPVTWALLDGNEYLATALIRKQKKITAQDCGIVYYSAAMGSVSTLNAALDAGADPEVARSERGHSPLIEAAYLGNTDTMRVLLDRKAAKLDEVTPFKTVPIDIYGTQVHNLLGGVTALMTAAGGGQLKAVKFLLERGADVNKRSDAGATALDYAQGQRKDTTAIIKVLIAAGAKKQSTRNQLYKEDR